MTHPCKEKPIPTRNKLLVMAILFILLSACGSAEHAATSIPQVVSVTATPRVVDVTATDQPNTAAPLPTAISSNEPPSSTATLVPAIATPEPVAGRISFVDSGQHLGSAQSWDVALGDLDGDGDLDAYVANAIQGGANNAVWINDGQGSFTLNEQTLGYGQGVALGDLDGDGDLDAIVTNWWGEEHSTVWLNDGSGIFADSGQNLGFAFQPALGDLDGDGDLDIFMAQMEANTIWLNDGGGVFNDTGQRLGTAITAAVSLGDLDGDGDLDALAGGWEEAAKVWLNDGAGTFVEHTQSLCPASVHIHDLALGDVDGDGDLDAFMAVASSHSNQVWLNDGTGAFSDSGQQLHSSLAHGVSLGDLDGDGDPDAVTAHGGGGSSGGKIWLNDGPGEFGESDLTLGNLYSSAIALGDLDSDGDLDAFIAHGDQSNESGGGMPNDVWLNEMLPTPLPVLTGNGSGVIAFYSERDGNAEIYTMNTDGSDQCRLTFNTYDDVSPVWSPDGSQIAFISNRDDPDPTGCFPECFYQLYIINADGSDEHKLVKTEMTIHHPDWHPDGTKLSFDSGFNMEGDIYIVNADGSGLQVLVEDGLWADWSPDGSQIVFSSSRDRNSEIYIADTDGSNQRRLTDNDRMDFFPAWSPDGERIVFGAGNFNERQIYIINFDGTNEQQLTTEGRVSEDPAWSPDGSQIVFQSNRTGRYKLYLMNANGSDQGLLTTGTGQDYWPSWGRVTTPKPGSILFEKSAQTFASIPTWKIGLADLDGDGDLDAAFANSQDNNSQVWLNDGSGTFTDTGQELGKYGHGIDVGDVDGDGDPDVVITTHNLMPTRVYLNDGQAVFQELEGAFDETTGHSVDLFDLDGDGDLDAVGEGRNKVSIFWNDGSGKFTDSELNFPMTTAWGDLDSDGDVDLFLKEDGAGYTVHLNDGTGNFSLYWNHPDSEAMSIGDATLGDLDSDGDLDVIITNGHHQSTSYPVMVFINDGSGQFSDSSQRLSAVSNAGASLGDLDGDGDLDLVLDDYLEPCQIWLNDGAAQFSDSGFRFGNDQFYRHALLGDLDGDGDLDIFLATFGMGQGSNEIWFNQGQEKLTSMTRSMNCALSVCAFMKLIAD
ncbi:MAG: FG-GAP-like repeat-containing protein [Chloroflexota bacterium]|nr:FG-GAP-like repeat-containing protein [Chloroflexota bacterium]